MGINKVAVVADLGESFGNYTIGADDELLELITTSNIACGFHAGDPRVLDRTVGECVKRGIEVGAHPGYPDLVGFGRRLIEASEDEIRTDVIYQLGALDAFARIHGVPISHVAPHGRMGSIAQTGGFDARRGEPAPQRPPGLKHRRMIAVQEQYVAVVAQRNDLAVDAGDRSVQDSLCRAAPD